MKKYGKKILALILVSVCIFGTACGKSSTSSSSSNATHSNVTTNSSSSSTHSNSTTNSSTSSSSSYVSGKSSLTGNLGSAGDCEGETIIITIIADDSKTSWDTSKSSDKKTLEDAFKYLGMATDYITAQAKSYGKDIHFTYGGQGTDLCYTAKLNCDTTAEDEKVDKQYFSYINKNIEPNLPSLMSKYNAKNVVFVALLNTPNSNEETSNTMTYYSDSEYPYEICYMFMHCEDEEETPAAFAHEILHTFGALDLYEADEEYGIPASYVKNLEKNSSNEIMYTTYDAKTDEPHYDSITNEISDVTAYYLGWISSSSDVTKYNMGKSEH